MARTDPVRALVSALAAIMLLLAMSCSATHPTGARSGVHRAAHRPVHVGVHHDAHRRAGSAPHKMLVIVFENHGRAEALAQMPHLRHWAERYGQATDYYAITHPSLPNYLAIFGASTFGVASDCAVGTAGCVPAPPSVFAQTIEAGRTARAYEQSMAGRCQTSTAGRYAARHGPWPYWTTARERRLCRGNDLPMGTLARGPLARDIARGNLPVTGEITPDFCTDGHDCPLVVADRWLARAIPKLMNGPDYRHGRLTIVITFDEGDGGSGNRVALVVIDPRLSHVTVRGRFDHYSLARWLESNARVRLLRRAARAPGLAAAFGL